MEPWSSGLPGLLEIDPLALLALAVLVGAGLLNLAAIGSADLVAHQLVAVVAGLESGRLQAGKPLPQQRCDPRGIGRGSTGLLE